ncbi:MAG: hypothetical protein VKJ27_10035 [Synechocystis sp.]|nr:hypothetical protein [Synechocystis sp.]
MSSSRGPYKSQLFSTLNRHSQRLRDRLGTTVRQIKVAAEWGVQALIYPFYWLLHPQKWLGPVFAAGAPSPSAALPPHPNDDGNADDDETFSSTLADRPIQAVLTTVQPWLLASDSSLDVPLTDPLGETLRGSLPLPIPNSQNPRPAIALEASPQSLAFSSGDPTPPSQLSHWGQQVKQLFYRPDPTIVIQGIACRCSDRQLVLTTQDNLTLDVLSLPQKQALEQLIRQELAQFRYHHRRHWALTQRRWRGIPLINGNTQEIIAPLDWLWQGIYRWQARPDVPGSLIPKAPPPLPALPKINAWVEQTTTALTHHPVIEATVVKSQQVSVQLMDAIPLSAFPPALQQRGEALRQKLSQGLANRENAPDLSADPFELTVLIQAAIAYFFGSGSRTPLSPSSPNTSPLTEGDDHTATPWLPWDELFAELPSPTLAQPLLSPPPPPSAQELVPTQIPAMTAPPTAAVNVTPAPHAAFSRWSPVADPWEDYFGEGSMVSPKLPDTKGMTVSPQSPTGLETAFDWIETSAKAMGYDKHILVWCLEWLDRLIYHLEVAIGRLWQWLKGRLGWPQNSSLSK